MTAIFCRFFLDDFMRNSNFGIGVLHVKHKILTYFWDVISLLAPVFIVSFDMACKEVSTKKIFKILYASVLLCDCTFKKQCTVPVTLTFDR